MRFLRILTILMSFFCLALSALSALSPPKCSSANSAMWFFYICDPFAERYGTGGKINSVHFCRVIATTHHCFLSGILSRHSAWRYLTFAKRFFFVLPFDHLYLSFYSLYLFLYSLYLFSKIQAKKIQASTSIRLRLMADSNSHKSADLALTLRGNGTNWGYFEIFCAFAAYGSLMWRSQLTFGFENRNVNRALVAKKREGGRGDQADRE